MDLIDENWLHARGALHDAMVVSVEHRAGYLEITIDDEWVNERGLTLPEGQKLPGTMVFENASIVLGEPMAAAGGWIEDVEMRDSEFHFAFCDRQPWAVKVTSANWRAQN